MSSRLFQEIRERRGLAYAVYSFFTSYVDTGMFGVYAGVGPGDEGQTIALVADQLRRLKDEPVDAETLAEAKACTKAGFLLSSESNENQMVRLSHNEIHFGTYTPTGEILRRVDEVTAEDIQSLARTLFRSEALALTVLGPAGEPQVLQEALAV
jgi:predicted Zn-dependent peptidase